MSDRPLPIDVARFEPLSAPPGARTETKAYVLRGPTVAGQREPMFAVECLVIEHPDFEPYAAKAREKIEKLFASLLDDMLN